MAGLSGPFWLRELPAPSMAEQMYVGEHIRLSGFPNTPDGRYEIVERTPLVDGLRLVIVPESIHTD